MTNFSSITHLMGISSLLCLLSFNNACLAETLPEVKLSFCCLTKSQRDDLLYYLRRLDRHIRRHFKCPRVVDSPKAIVKFKIVETGELVGSPVIQRKSGSPQYDEAIVSALEESKPFPPLPAHIPSVEVTCLFGVFDILSKPPQIIEQTKGALQKNRRE